LDGAGEASRDGLREEDGLSKLADAFRESNVLPERFFRRGTELVGLGKPRLLLGCFVVDGIRMRPLFTSQQPSAMENEAYLRSRGEADAVLVAGSFPCGVDERKGVPGPLA